MARRRARFGLFLAIFFSLTMITQIGGVVYIISRIVAKLFRRRDSISSAPTVVVFVALYASATIFIVPPRKPLPCLSADQKPYTALSPIYCVLNRHYAVPGVHKVLEALSQDLGKRYPGIKVGYLDAGFPFFDRFPLLPHLSHHDGRKLDLAFFYKHVSGKPLTLYARSLIGYWGFEQPGPGDKQPCQFYKEPLNLRLDMAWLKPFLRPVVLDHDRTRAMLHWLVNEGKDYGVEKVLLEPYLAARLKVSSPRLRFQGCRAARHDDHLHFQISAKRL